ncbi:PAS domain S-box-containing protein [Azospirillum fermentarium]|nr:PAS domain S-box-containing protein [Azospirillum fermentarium]
MAETLPQLVWSADAHGHVDYMNGRWFTYTGQPPVTGMALGWMEVLHPDDREATVARWFRSMTSGEPYEMEHRLRGADGEYRWFLCRGLPLRDGAGRLVRWFGTSTDISGMVDARHALARSRNDLEELVARRTAQLEDANRRLIAEIDERRQAEAALRQAQKMEAIGKLTGGVAHDFNNLLQIISGNLQLLERDAAMDTNGHRRLQTAIAAVGRGAKLAAQLLAFARRQPLEPRPVDLSRLLGGMDDLLRRALGETVHAATHAEPGLWPALIDPAELENVVLNLAVNARDAMAGSGALTIRLENAVLDVHAAARLPDAAPGDYVMLSVADTGCGMAPDVLERVFEPFFTTKPDGQGTGLGLSMVYGFVRQSGGCVTIDSRVGEGTVVRLLLPRAATAAEDAPVAETGPVVGGCETILVVEDDPDVRATVVDLLTDLGYRVLKAPDAQSALSIIETGVPIDLLFTDVVMPGPLRSTELARRAQDIHPGLAVLFTSGYTDGAIVHDGRLDPGVSLLSKPYNREDLARQLRRMLGRRSAAPAAVPAPTPAPDRHLRILFVEDDALIRMATTDLLLELGYAVTDVPDAESAVPLLDQEPWDVLFTDVSLPGMSGIALAEQALARAPELTVIVSSGYGRDMETLNTGLPLLYLPKPYDLDRVEQVLAAARARAAG